jgi:predicted phage terminase large subunit-like protein
MTLIASSIVDKRRAREEKARRRMQRDFTVYKGFIYPHYLHSPHLQALDELLMQVSLYARTEGAEGVGQAIIEMPPRHGKSVTVSRLFPTWHIGNNPDHRIMMVGYGASLAEKHSRYARNLMKTQQYEAVFAAVDSNGIIYKRVELAQDSKSVQEWDLEGYEGGASALGIGGAATGKGANILIVDDPIKSRAEAESEVYREKVWDSYQDDLLTRLEPGGAVIIIHTRWHADDLIGRLLANEESDWTRLRLPALAEENDPLGREIDEPLWAARFGFEYLAKVREKRGEYSWASLYQQRPMPSKAGLFDVSQIDVIDYDPECNAIVRFYDLAVTAKKHSDYTVGIKMGITQNEDIIILDVYRVQKTMPDVEKGIAQNAVIDGKETRIRLEAEKAGIVQLDYLLRRDDMRGYTIDAKAPIGDKYTRAQPFASRVNAGKVKLRRAAWNRGYLDELSVFPMGANDDQVDGSSGAYEMLSDTTIPILARKPVKGLYERRNPNMRQQR